MLVATGASVFPGSVSRSASVPAVAMSTGQRVSARAVARIAVVEAVTITRVGTTPAPFGSSGWYGLAAIRDEWIEVIRENEAELANPRACPNDGEPMLVGPAGQLYCPFDGWRP